MAHEAAQLDEVEHLFDALVALAALHAQQLERQTDVALHVAPLEEDRRLEDHAVLAPNSRLVSRLAVHLDRPAGGLR